MYLARGWTLLLVLLFAVSCAQIPKAVYDPTVISEKSESSEDSEQAAIIPSEVEPPSPDQATKDTQEKKYSIFYDEGDHLKELTLAGKYKQAVDF